MNLLLILGNQLIEPSLLSKVINPNDVIIFMREDRELCTYYKFHKHKIVFFLSAMRHYAEELQDYGFTVHYEKLNSEVVKYEKKLTDFIQKKGIKNLYYFEIEDKFFDNRIVQLCTDNKIEKNLLESPLFLTSRVIFADYLTKSKKPFMKNFYEQQRKRLNILVDDNNKPLGGKWSYDEDNRKKLPLSVLPPEPMLVPKTDIVVEVSELCNDYFSEHPGNNIDFWLPVTRSDAKKWLENFLEQRLANFGPYEDALAQHSTFVFHSVLSPLLNNGLLLPQEVVEKTLLFAKENSVPLASLEGFIRQIIGWREFIRGIYQHYSEYQETSNFWQHSRKLSPVWYQATTGIPPLDNVLSKVLRYGYAHHIERLMVLGNLMLLLEVEPKEAHRWFMEMFVDSSDWVMGPNVYGMALFSDGGIFATKPYICGSNYYRKMGSYKSEPWCDAIDGLYWQFIDKHQDFFIKNPRLSLAVKNLQRMTASKKKQIYQVANELREKLTIS